MTQQSGVEANPASSSGLPQRETRGSGSTAPDERTYGSPAEEGQDLNYRPPPASPAPQHRRCILQRKRKRPNTQEGPFKPGRKEHGVPFHSPLVRSSPPPPLPPLSSCLQLAQSTRPVREEGTERPEESEMPPQPPQPQVRKSQFLKSFLGIIRVLQVVFGAGLWVTIAANKYEGSIHFVLFVAVLFWLLTLALFFLTLLGKQDLVPLLGGRRWLGTNLAHDVAAAALYLPALGVMAYKTTRNEYCNLDQYKHPCLYKVYLTAAVFACLCCLVYLLSVIHGACRKCRGEQTVL